MSAQKLLQAHKYTEAIAEFQQCLALNPNDIGAVDGLASAFRAVGNYRAALPLFERVGSHEQACKLTSGHPGRQMDVSCLHWFLGNRKEAVQLMRGLAEGTLDGTINYGDAAGGVTPGLLLYYMAVTEDLPQETSFALKYMKSRSRRSSVGSWPGPVVRYYLGEITFNDLLYSATGQQELPAALETARAKLLSRRRLCSTLFHDGVRRRAEDAEQLCQTRMRECYGLENPLIEPEWYLARYEAGHVDQAAKA